MDGTEKLASELRSSEVLLGVIWRFWKRILLISLLAAVAAYSLSYLLPRKYTASATFYPEGSRSGMSNIPMVNLLGEGQLNLSSEGRSPEFFSRLIKSRRILSRVVDSSFVGGTLCAYYDTCNKIDSTQAAVNHLRKDLTVSVDRIPQIVHVGIELKDPKLASDVTRRLLELTGEISAELRKERIREREGFLNDRLAEAEQRLVKAEEALRVFLQANRSLDSPTLKFEENSLERRVNLAQDLYLYLTRETQTTGIEAVDNSPRISVIDFPNVPSKPSSPRRSLIALVALIGAGALMTLLLVLRAQSSS